MKKKQYDKPSMKIVALQQRTMLLAGSTGSVDNPGSFTPGGDPLNPEP